MITPMDALPVINRLAHPPDPGRAAAYLRYELKNVQITSIDVNASGA
jgi:hypothetical protein